MPFFLWSNNNYRVSCFYNYVFNFQPAECQALIEKLRSCSRKELLEELKKIDTWTFGKCELFHWIEILDLCDSILESAASRVNPKSWQLSCDLPANSEVSNSHLVCPSAHLLRAAVLNSFQTLQALPLFQKINVLSAPYYPLLINKLVDHSRRVACHVPLKSLVYPLGVHVLQVEMVAWNVFNYCLNTSWS